MPLPKSLKIDVVLAPNLLTEVELGGSLCAVIDVLRATSTLAIAFSKGIQRVFPFKNKDEVRAFAATLSPGSYLLGGEERSVRIPGFDMGNSLTEFSEADVRGKTLLFSTSNGTPTLQRTYAGSRAPVFLASLLNISAVCAAMINQAEDGRFNSLTFVCSGRQGKPSSEDTFCAGVGVQKISQLLVEKESVPELTDCAFIAAHFAWSNTDKALAVLTNCEHGRSLLPLGFAKDIELAAEVDKYGVTPVFDGRVIEIPQPRLI
jgi:2-phosphosulfolactate phosphatase